MFHFPLIILPHLIQGWPTSGFYTTGRYWAIEVWLPQWTYVVLLTADVRTTFLSVSPCGRKLSGSSEANSSPTSSGTQLGTQLHPMPHWVLRPKGTIAVFCLGATCWKIPHLGSLSRGLPLLGHWKVWGFFKMLVGPRGLSSHNLVNCILESEIWVKVELTHITRSGNRFRLQLQHGLVYLWKKTTEKLC